MEINIENSFFLIKDFVNLATFNFPPINNCVMKAPKKPNEKNPMSKPMSSKKESDEDEDDDFQENERMEEDDDDDFDVPLDDLDTFESYDDDDDDDDRY